MKDTWWHTMDNVQHNARGTQRFQSCGKFNMPDMLTVGSRAWAALVPRATLFAYLSSALFASKT